MTVYCRSDAGLYFVSPPRTTVTSARIPDKDACHRACNLCVFSHVQKGTGLTRNFVKDASCSVYPWVGHAQ